MSAFSLLSDVDDDQPRVEALKQKEAAAAAAARASPDLAELASSYNRSTMQPASPSRVGGSSTAHADSRAPFQSTKVLGEDVVVIRHLSKRYQLAGRNGAGHGDSKNNGRLGSTPASAGQEGDEVVALRHINLIPLGEEPEADAAEEAGSLQPRLPRSLDVPARGSMAHSSHMHPIRRGEFIMIRGPSGGGKTTLLNILGTIDEASSGSVEMFGRTISKASTDKELAQLRLEKIGFVFQTFNLLATMSAFENVELPMVILGKLSRAACKARALELLDLVGLQDRYAHLPSELSGGEQQRVTIARALANEPELLLLDEPTGDLDSRNTVDVMDLILRINLGTLGQPVVDGASSGGGNGGGARAKQALTATSTTPTTVVMVTHNPDLECYADRILYVEDGAFKKQALNRKQRRIQYDKFLEYINKSN